MIVHADGKNIPCFEFRLQIGNYINFNIPALVITAVQQVTISFPHLFPVHDHKDHQDNLQDEDESEKESVLKTYKT